MQAAIPALVPPARLMAGNAVINMVNSLSGILGPVLGGVLFSIWGLEPVLMVSIGCFFASAVMEIFIHIPFEKRPAGRGVLAVAADDLRESCVFVFRTRPEIARVGLLLTLVNLVFSALIIIGLPVIVNQQLGFSQSVGNRLYGYAEGALAVGGLLGGLLAGALGQRLKVAQAARLIFACSLTLLPMGLVLLLPVGPMAAYLVIAAACTVMMAFSTLFSVEMITYVQQITPPSLTGKVMALLTCLVMAGNPVGQAVYGLLFEHFAAGVSLLFFGAFALCLPLCLAAQRLFGRLNQPAG